MATAAMGGAITAVAGITTAGAAATTMVGVTIATKRQEENAAGRVFLRPAAYFLTRLGGAVVAPNQSDH